MQQEELLLASDCFYVLIIPLSYFSSTVRNIRPALSVLNHIFPIFFDASQVLQELDLCSNDAERESYEP